MLKRLCMIDGDTARLVCPWHGVQDDDGLTLACGCQLETGAHGRVFAIRCQDGRNFAAETAAVTVNPACMVSAPAS